MAPQEACICKRCGGTFYLYPSQLKASGRGNYCSVRCRAGEVLTLECEVCGREFTCKPSDVKHSKHHSCSKECDAIWRKTRYAGANNPSYRPQSHIVVTCKQCGCTFHTTEDRINVGRAQFCSMKCKGKWQSEHMMGDAHPHWFDGDREYPSEWMKARQAAREGVESCSMCGKSEEENGRRLPVHHIDYDKKNCDMSNLIPLCNSCHTKTNFHRSFWMFVFALRNRVPPLDWQHKAVICG